MESQIKDNLLLHAFLFLILSYSSFPKTSSFHSLSNLIPIWSRVWLNYPGFQRLFMKINETSRSAVACCRSAVSVVAQARPALLASYLKHHTPISTAFPSGHSRRYESFIYPHPYPHLLFHWLISVTGAWFHWRGGSRLEGAGLPAMGV